MVGMVITFLIVLGIILLSVLIIVIPDLSKAKKRKEDADINYSQYTKDMASDYYEKYITPTEHIIQTKVEEVIENIKKEYTVSTVIIDSFVVSDDVSNVKVYRDDMLLTNRYVQKAIDIQEIVEETLNNNTVVF
ncbi:hypothetical protein Koombakaat1_00088 [Staphylococcus phage Koomba-kaat_1]|nr:hypothetical protein Koombakaat1_00088 [Staphylococcus phage Koomba-kaat_1]